MSKTAIMSRSITKDGFPTSDTISVLLQILMSRGFTADQKNPHKTKPQ